jgi:hypothetical protein
MFILSGDILRERSGERDGEREGLRDTYRPFSDGDRLLLRLTLGLRDRYGLLLGLLLLLRLELRLLSLP